MKHLWQQPSWPTLRWDSEAQAAILTEEALTTSAIEGERLNRDSVRSSVARHLGLPTAGLAPANGRLARAVTEMAMAQDERLPTRYYSLSSQIMAERSAYYRVLERCQKGDGDVTRWLQWHVACYARAVARAERLIAGVLAKVSRATAFREIAELVDKGLLIQNPARGRSVSYDIKWS